MTTIEEATSGCLKRLVLGALIALAATTSQACTSSDATTPASGAEAPPPPPTPTPTPTPTTEQPAQPPQAGLPFAPSNIPSSPALDLTNLPDVDVDTDASIDTTDGRLVSTSTNAFRKARFSQVVQSDGSKITLMLVHSLRIEQTATLDVIGTYPLAVIAAETIDVVGTIHLGDSNNPGAGAFHDVDNNWKGLGPGGGERGDDHYSSGGAGYCGRGGMGATDSSIQTAKGGVTYGTPQLVPLLGGSASGRLGFAGGGALQLVGGRSITIASTGVVNAGGIAYGGSGGAVLIESSTVTIAGALTANGAGGHGASGAAEDGKPSASPAAAEKGGGVGSAGDVIDGADAMGIAKYPDFGGGGGAGRIRINTLQGNAAISGVISPSLSTPCATQARVAAR